MAESLCLPRQRELSRQLLHPWLPCWPRTLSPVGRSRPFSTKRTSGCRQKEKPQNPSQLSLRPPPADADRLAAINFYLVKAQRVPVAGIDSVSEKQITRLWGGVWGWGVGDVLPCLWACPGNLFSLILQNTWWWPQIKLNAAAPSLLPAFISSFPILVKKLFALIIINHLCLVRQLFPACACPGGWPHPSFPSLCMAANKGSFVGTWSALALVGMPVLLS